MRVAHNPNPFLESPAIIDSVNQAISRAKLSDITSFDHLLIITYLAANIIFSNAQRPGVVQYMMVQEFETRSDIGDEQILIAVTEHKTAVLGPANVVISKKIETMMLGYFNYVRSRIQMLRPEYNTRFFFNLHWK